MKRSSFSHALYLLWTAVFAGTGFVVFSHRGIPEKNPQNSQEKNGITLTPVTDSPAYPDAALKQYLPVPFTHLAEGKVKFSYGLKNYHLGMQTGDADHKNCANSAKGQHIHLILNNQPYLAKYDTVFEEELAPGHYISLSFLSRSYHESIKTKTAYVLTQFTVGDTVKDKNTDLSGPLLFYSRPKGEYVGEDTKKILLDFYLVNTTLSQNGNHVRAVINGAEFILTDWVPYVIGGLPLGEVMILLELTDAKGNVISGTYNHVIRKIMLKES